MRTFGLSLSLVVPLLLSAGCTGGQVVDYRDGSDWQVHSVSYPTSAPVTNASAEVSFQSYDNPSTIYTAPIVFNTKPYGSIFSFDPYTPASAENVHVDIPDGDYIVRVTSNYTNAQGARAWAIYCPSAVLHHKGAQMSQYYDYWQPTEIYPTTAYRIRVDEVLDDTVPAPSLNNGLGEIPVSLCDYE